MNNSKIEETDKPLFRNFKVIGVLYRNCKDYIKSEDDSLYIVEDDEWNTVKINIKVSNFNKLINYDEVNLWFNGLPKVSSCSYSEFEEYSVFTLYTKYRFSLKDIVELLNLLDSTLQGGDQNV